MFKLNDRVALVTGAERGLGNNIALTLAEQGANVIVHYFQEKENALRTTEKIKAMGKKAFAIYADLTDQEQTNEMVSRIKSRFSAVDILVNNVGAVVKRIDFIDEGANDEFWFEVFKINVLSAVHCARAFLPEMIERGYGRIINISSAGSRTGGAPKSVHYSAMKGAINSMTHSLSNEVAKYGVTVNAIAPGTMISPLLKETPSWSEEDVKRLYPIGRMAETSDISPMVAFLASEEARYCTGEIFWVTGGR